jgi:hypothetical protein
MSVRFSFREAPALLGPRELGIISWPELQKAMLAVTPDAYDWVDDDSILEAFNAYREGCLPLPDTRQPHTAETHRARRIAAIAYRMLEGDVFPPLIVDLRRGSVYLRDGHHRLRALRFLHRTDRVCIAYATYTY